MPENVKEWNGVDDREREAEKLIRRGGQCMTAPTGFESSTHREAGRHTEAQD